MRTVCTWFGVVFAQTVDHGLVVVESNGSTLLWIRSAWTMLFIFRSIASLADFRLCWRVGQSSRSKSHCNKLIHFIQFLLVLLVYSKTQMKLNEMYCYIATRLAHPPTETRNCCNRTEMPGELGEHLANEL